MATDHGRWRRRGLAVGCKRPFGSIVAVQRRLCSNRFWRRSPCGPFLAKTTNTDGIAAESGGKALFLKTTNGCQQFTGGSCSSDNEVVYVQGKQWQWRRSDMAAGWKNGVALIWQQGERNLRVALLVQNCHGAVVVLWQPFLGRKVLPKTTNGKRQLTGSSRSIEVDHGNSVWTAQI